MADHAHQPADPDHWDPQACSVLGDVLDEPAYGTASVARGWVALEQPGPWGRDAASQSHLDPETGAALSRRLATAGGRLVLVRGTGQHADDHHERPRTVLVSSCVPESSWLLTARLDDPAVLADLDVEAVVRGDVDATRRSLPALEPTEEPVFLLCTNGRRDVCCAVRGRPVAHAAAELRPGQVWETSHTGGHRFAPTGVLLPSGVTLARLRTGDVVAALDAAAAGQLPPELLGPRHDRGRSALAAPEQAAESSVRALTGECRLDALRTRSVPALESPAAGDHVRVMVEDAAAGRSWTVDVRRARRDPDRRVSCGKAPEPQTAYAVEVEES